MEAEKKDLIDNKVLPIPMIGKELARFEGETFYIAEHECAVVYHVYNSMDLIIRPNMTSTYGMLVDIVRNKDEYEKLEGEEREHFELTVSAMTHILNSPLVAFSDIEYTYELATFIVKHLNDLMDKALNEPLQKETFEENQMFQDAALAIEDIKKSLEEEEEKPKRKKK